MDVESCLPEELRGPSTTITKIAAGLSGAGVYRVDAAGQAFVLKVSSDEEPLIEWRRKVDIRQLAANAGLAPTVVHVDESRRAVVSAFVADRGFLARYGDPRTRDDAVALLGRTLRRVHELPLPVDATSGNPTQLLATIWSSLSTFPLPSFVGDAVRRMLAEEAPGSERPAVVSHNDVNPSNLVHDGDHLLLLDWETAGPNDPWYDLAAIAVFLRMDEASCRRLLTAHDGEPVSVLPARFAYNRRLIAVLCGAMGMHLARQSGYAAATADETLDSTPSLGDFYQRLRAGLVRLDTPEGKWSFGLALLRESFSM